MSYAAPHNHRMSEHSFFFTPQERDHVRHAKTENIRSITTKALWPLWRWVSVTLVPETVAPNAIALLGVIFAVQAFQVTANYYADNPVTTTNAAVALILASVVCSSMDGVHAIRCRSGTALGKIFSKVCSAIRHVFLCLTLFPVLGITNPQVQWYLLMSIQLVQLSNLFYQIDNVEERKWLKTGGKGPQAAAYLYRLTKTASSLFNTTEASLAEVALLLARQYLAPSPEVTEKYLNPLLKQDQVVAQWVFYCTLASCLFTLMVMRAPNQLTKLPILLCIVVRAIEPLSFVMPMLSTAAPPVPTSADDMLGGRLGLIADGAMLGLLSIEVRVSATSNRRIHSAVIAIIFLAMGSAVFSLFCGTLYCIGMLTDLAYTTGTPLFVPVRNVYIDGVFDLCHIGHKRLMENALTHGNRLVVGVMSDEECVSYKRRPVMTTDERCREVGSCKWVSEVVRDCPAHGLTEEFIEEYNIHAVCYGEEYNKPEDKYYAVARKLGIAKTAPRTTGMSTSEIIKRIQDTNPDEMVAKDKLTGGSTVTL